MQGVFCCLLVFLLFSWARYSYQDNLNMPKYPSGRLYRRPFPNTLEICTWLPSGILRQKLHQCLRQKLAKVKATKFTRFTDKAISQNVRLLGCVNKTRKNCGYCCCSSRLVAPTKKPGKGKKAQHIEHWIESVRVRVRVTQLYPPARAVEL